MEYLPSEFPAKVAGEKITALLQRYSDVPVLLLVSGGSALAVLEQIAPVVLTPKLTISVVDERFDHDPLVNNFAQLSKLAFFAKAATAGASSISTAVTEGESLDSVTTRYETALSNWRAENPTGVVLAILGMGTDGHTAGIMPGYASLFASTTAAVVGYEVIPEVSLYTKRITVTPRFLEQAVAAAVAYVVGSEKRPLLERILEQTADQNTYPAILWHKMPNLTLVTDQR
jgi:6-phosphogluconolactonase/glucosamine-6-phosphate isomerase/deaminase